MLILITGGSSCGKSAFAEELAVKMRNEFGKHGEQAVGHMVYIATMEPFSEDAAKKIKRHHELRGGKGFITLEHYTDIEKVIPKLGDFTDMKGESPCQADFFDVEKSGSCRADFFDVEKSGSSRADFFDTEKISANLDGPADGETRVQNSADAPGGKKPVILLECLSNLLANEMFAPGVTEEMRAQPTFEGYMCRKICAGIWKLEKAAACFIVVSCNVGEDGASYAWETVKYIHILQKIQAELAREAASAYEVVCGIPVVLK